jgi:NAD(P)-dependent dehydrogenase (short-subunit alcohol dehydrogenase family)
MRQRRGGLIPVADVPALEACAYSAAAKAAGLELVMIAAPNTPPPVLQRIASLSGGYTYCVARAGVTGTSDRLALDHDALFGGLAEAGAPPPVLGFGISTPDQVRDALASGAAGVIAGSALVKCGCGRRGAGQSCHRPQARYWPVEPRRGAEWPYHLKVAPPSSTGAGGGLGRTHALLLARAGAKVVVNDVPQSIANAEKVVEEIRSAVVRPRRSAASVTDEAAVAEWWLRPARSTSSSTMPASCATRASPR